MKAMLLLSILLCMLPLPALAELTDADLNKIRLIVNEEVTKELAKELAPIKADIAQLDTQLRQLDTRLRSVEIAVAALAGRIDGIEGRIDGVDGRIGGLEGRIGGVEKQIVHATNVTYGLIALIVVAIGIPAWWGKRDRDQEQKIEALRQEIEALKHQKTVSP